MTENQNIRRLLLQPCSGVLIYRSLIAYGAYAFWKIRVEVLPRFNFPQISIITHRRARRHPNWRRRSPGRLAGNSALESSSLETPPTANESKLFIIK